MAPLLNQQFAAYVGIDWADSKHDVCIQAANSNRRVFDCVPHQVVAVPTNDITHGANAMNTDDCSRRTMIGKHLPQNRLRFLINFDPEVEWRALMGGHDSSRHWAAKVVLVADGKCPPSLGLFARA